MDAARVDAVGGENLHHRDDGIGTIGNEDRIGLSRGRVERPCHGERLQHVGLHGGDLEVVKPAGDVSEHVRVRVEDGHPAAGWKARVLDEVPGARSDIEVIRTDVLPVPTDPLLGRAAPDVAGDRPEDERVVEPQQQLVVVALSAICRVVPIHRP